MNKLINFWRNEKWRLLFALLLTAILYYNLSDKPIERNLSGIPLKINVSSNLFLPADFSKRVKLTVKCSSREWERLQKEEIYGQISINENMRGSDGKFRITLTEANFNCKPLPVTGIFPAVVEIPVIRRISRDIEIKPALRGSALAGYEVIKTNCKPSQVTVSGPEATVNALMAIGTEPVSLEWDSDFQKELRLINPSPAELTLKTDRVQLDVIIRQKRIISKEFSDIPVRYLFTPLHAGNRLAATLPIPGKVSVTVTGPAAELSKILPENIVIYADLSASRFREPGNFKAELSGKVSAVSGGSGQLRISGIEPVEVSVTITRNKHK